MHSRLNRLIRYHPLRLYSSAIANPTIKANPFSEKPLPTRILDLPHNTYPNPLLSFTKSQILDLKDIELNYLLSLQGGSSAELEQLFLNLMQILNDQIILNPKKAAYLLEAFENSNLELPLAASLKISYKNNLLRRSIVAFLDDPMDPHTRSDVIRTLKEISETSSLDKQEVANLVYNYLHKLSALRQVNTRPIYLSDEVLNLLMDHLNPLEKRHLFSYLVSTNIRFGTSKIHNDLVSSLLESGPLSKLVARTGLMNAKWHDVAKYEYEDIEKERMIAFFSFRELKSFAEYAVHEKNILDSNMYIELLLTKFEQANDISYLQELLEIMLLHSMTIKGPQECVRFFSYSIEKGFALQMDTILKVLKNLREEGLFDEALFLVNYLHKEDLNQKQRRKFVSEIMHVMFNKFSDHPQIIVGYFTSLFNDSSNSASYLLKNLGLLDLIYGVEKGLADVGDIKLADIHEDLKGSKLTHQTLSDLYSVVLRGLDLNRSTNPLFIRELYVSYADHIKKAMTDNDSSSLFHQNNLDENVITLFAEYLLRAKPHERESMELSDRRLNFEVAKYMVDDFMSTVNVARTQKKTYLVDLMIYSSLMQHNDISYALKLLKHARSSDLPITFNQIYPFISYHLLRNEPDIALHWYQILVENGVKARSKAADNLFATAKRLDWPVKGTQYKSASRKRSKEIKKSEHLLASDPIAILPTNASSSAHKLFGFVEELAAVLNPLSKDKNTAS
ncbi:hypothetical protein PUMCH_004852 [Australozyma saopauloensis]|uniref:Mitochondrial translation factor ATP22 n=1 Tax=Australozyma saopauloensis TaxID=291208 RepID=A0AAX4HFR9_9ASCO|nr:hypothetical protein PUMCH_004852 [[Candida] saopauloensis]